MSKNNEKTYKIGEVAEMLGVHEDTLRNWDEQGAVVAERFGTRQDRRYTAEHIKMIKEKGLVSDLARRQPIEEKDYSEYTKEELVRELRVLKEQKRYGLVWEEKVEEVVERCKREAPILEPVKKMNVKGKENEQRHIMIEGDNYHSLQVLNYTHKGKIDVIYIDPPYNTGNKDFIFNDSFVDKEDTYRHSKWLSFMEKRLRLAKDLLSSKGVIFISVDDNECANLRLLCDGIFGEENVEVMVWHKVGGGDASDGKMKITHRFRREHEYVLVVYDNKASTRFNKTLELPDFKNKYTNPDNDPRGEYKQGIISKTELKSKESGKNYYEVVSPSGKKTKRQWNFDKDEFEILDKDNRIYWGKNGNSVPSRKIFINEYKPTTPISILSNKGSARVSRKNLEQDFDLKFSNPKPISLIEYLLKISSSKNATILDFFAGSGTTGHAVMELNKEDGGNRQFILCTNNENNNGNGDGGIAESVCQPRIKKVMEGYKKNGDGEKVAGLGGSLEYLRTAFVDVDDIGNVSDAKRLKFTHQAGHVIALKENAFIEKEKNEWYQIFTDGKDKHVGLYFREDIERLAELENEILDKKEVKLYIFSHGGGDDWLSDYEEYDHVTVEDIPEPILRVYRGLNS